jgi:hypothetical protein
MEGLGALTGLESAYTTSMDPESCASGSIVEKPMTRERSKLRGGGLCRIVGRGMECSDRRAGNEGGNTVGSKLLVFWVKFLELPCISTASPNSIGHVAVGYLHLSLTPSSLPTNGSMPWLQKMVSPPRLRQSFAANTPARVPCNFRPVIHRFRPI